MVRSSLIFFYNFLRSFSWSKTPSKWASFTFHFLTSACSKTRRDVTEGTGQVKWKSKNGRWPRPIFDGILTMKMTTKILEKISELLTMRRIRIWIYNIFSCHPPIITFAIIDGLLKHQLQCYNQHLSIVIMSLQAKSNFEAYYRDALRYLGCVDIASIPGKYYPRRLSSQVFMHNLIYIRFMLGIACATATDRYSPLSYLQLIPNEVVSSPRYLINPVFINNI